MPRSGSLDVAAIAGDAPEVFSLETPTWEMENAQFLQINWEVDDAAALGADAAVAAPVDPAVRLVLRRALPGVARGRRSRSCRCGWWCGPASGPAPCASARCATRPPSSPPCGEHWGYPVQLGEVVASQPPRPGAVHGVARRPRGGRLRRPHRRRHQRQRPDDVRQPPPGAPRAARRKLVQIDPEYTIHQADRGRPEVHLPDPQALGMQGVAEADVARSSASRSGPTPTWCRPGSRSTPSSRRSAAPSASGRRVAAPQCGAVPNERRLSERSESAPNAQAAATATGVRTRGRRLNAAEGPRSSQLVHSKSSRASWNVIRERRGRPWVAAAPDRTGALMSSITPAPANDPSAAPPDLLEDALFQIKRVIVGQDRMVERALVCLLARGHCLLEGVPGVAKTLAVSTMAHVTGGSFRRLQFTPDLVPADIVGTRIWRPSREAFDIEWGPIFANMVLADEINRAPAKVQSALLEAMAEGHVSIAGETRPLPDAVPRAGHPEPDRVRGRLHAGRGPARPVPHADRRQAPELRRGDRDRPAHGRAPADGRAGPDVGPAAGPAGPGRRRVRAPRRGRLRRAPRHGHPRPGGLGPARPRPPPHPRRQPPGHARPDRRRPGPGPAARPPLPPAPGRVRRRPRGAAPPADPLLRRAGRRTSPPTT